MERIALDIYDDMPSQMKKYISNYGWHFNREACDYATSLMRKNNSRGDQVAIEPYTKKQVEELLAKYGVHIENNSLYDFVFVANMCKADYLGSSIADEMHLAKYIKDVIDDVDASPETTFRRWVATMVGNGQPISWSDFL